MESWRLSKRANVFVMVHTKDISCYCILLLGIGPYLWNTVFEAQCLLLILPQSIGISLSAGLSDVLFYFSPSKNLKHSTGIPANCVTKSPLRHFIQRAWRGKQYNPLHNNCPWATWWIWKVLMNLQLCLQVKCALINTGNEEVQIPGLINLLSGENSISAGPMAFENHLGNIF